MVTRYAKQVTVELRAMQLINTVEALNEKMKASAAASSEGTTGDKPADEARAP
jgi:hypothetical protein